MDNYSNDWVGRVGTQVLIAIWADDSGKTSNKLYEFTSAISVVDGDGALGGMSRKHADFPTTTLFANTSYWVGMFGDTTANDFAQAIVRNIPDGNGHLAQFDYANDYSSLNGLGDMAFRLYGNGGSIPEPTTFALLGLGLAGIAVSRRTVVAGFNA